MPDAPDTFDASDAFDLVGQEGRLVRTTRMIAKDERISDARRKDIRERVKNYMAKHGLTQKEVARQIGYKHSTVSGALTGSYGVDKRGRRKCDAGAVLRALNNWIELDTRRRNVVSNQEFVETAVAREIIKVAEIVAETCKIGVVYGPAQIGKSFTLDSLDDSDPLGNPVLFRIDESHTRPLPLCRLICERFKLPTSYTFDRLSRRLVQHLVGTKRMLMFDEAERCDYRTLEFIRDLHDQTGCPILLAGKPAIYQKLGFRQMDDYREVVDQLSSRVVIRRDLTARTRRGKGNNDPSPAEALFTREDIQKLIQVANLDLKVGSDAVAWLQRRSNVLGLGGFGMAKILLYLAYKYAISTGSRVITADILDQVEDLCVGREDAERIDQLVADPQAQRIRRLA